MSLDLSHLRAFYPGTWLGIVAAHPGSLFGVDPHHPANLVLAQAAERVVARQPGLVLARPLPGLDGMVLRACQEAGVPYVLVQYRPDASHRWLTEEARWEYHTAVQNAVDVVSVPGCAGSPSDSWESVRAIVHQCDHLLSLWRRYSSQGQPELREDGMEFAASQLAFQLGKVCETWTPGMVSDVLPL